MQQRTIDENENKPRSGALARKLLCTCLLAVLAVFVYFNIDSLGNEKNTKYPEDTSGMKTLETDIRGTGMIEQEFTAASENVKHVRLYFKFESGTAVSGKFRVFIKDGNKNVFESELDGKYIDSRGATYFKNGGDSASLNLNRITDEKVYEGYKSVRLEKGKEYKLTIEYTDIKADSPVNIRGYSGKDKSTFVRFSFDYLDVSKKLFIAVVVMMVLLLVLIWFPYSSFDVSDGSVELLNILVFILTPIVMLFVMHKISGIGTMEFLERIYKTRALMNLAIIWAFHSLFWFITNRFKAASVLTTISMFGFSFMNYLLLLFRDYPLIASDVFEIKTALSVADSYNITFDKYSMISIIVSAVWLIFILCIRGVKGHGLKTRAAALAVFALFTGGIYYELFKTDIIAEKNWFVSGFKPKASYRRNGYALSFFVTVRGMFVDKPAGYSIEAVRSITGGFESDPAAESAEVSESTPNIIAVMNESFSDLAVMGELDVNTDYMPFYHSLKENTVKGWMHSSIFGGSTADSEFEFLTGNSMYFLPYRSIPFRSMIKTETISLAGTLKDSGYGGITAFHPGTADSYNRNNVYPLLGFDKVMSIDDIGKPEKIRDFVSDDQDYHIVEQEYEEFRKTDAKTPYFMFNVTIQNHGGYALGSGVVDAGIEVEDPELRDEEAVNFLNLMKYSDNALKSLIEYFNKVDEPTVIVLFGDHQPRVGSSFYKAMFGKTSGELSAAEADLKYKVPFMIWANYDIDEQENVEISCNFLSAYTRSIIGGRLTGYDKFLLSIRDKLPSVSAISVLDTEGNVYESETLSDEQKKILNDYRLIQYNGFIDSGNREESFFRLK